jgi:hypothetical protein
MPGLLRDQSRNKMDSVNDCDRNDRRSSHNPVATTKGNEKSASTHKRTRRTKSGPPATITVEERSLLLQLSECCNVHLKFHKSEDDDENYKDNEKRCAMALDSVRHILPKVERAYRYQPSSNKKRGPEAAEVAHLCAFYRDVMLGGYCPKAPGLFQTAQGNPDVPGGMCICALHGVGVQPETLANHIVFALLQPYLVVSNTDATFISPTENSLSVSTFHGSQMDNSHHRQQPRRLLSG